MPQVYQLLGSTDLIGNPVGLMNDLQKGAQEFYSIPIEEAMKGDQGSIWKGL